MAEAFEKTIFPVLAETDILFINGDFFDTLVIFDSHGFDPIYDLILRLFKMCDQHKVALRIMRGTWTHDRNQIRRFNAFYRNSHSTFDFRIVETIDFESIVVRNRTLRFMYVPDDLPFKSSDDIVAVINDKLVELGWNYVDYGCMHGFFEFTYPKGVSQENTIVFREDQFPFIRKLINVGHVHHYGNSGNVFSNGSFDRLCHGEEEIKGCIKVLDYPDHYTAQFVENKYAEIFDTLFFSETDTTEIVRDKISAHLGKIISSRVIHLRFVSETLEFQSAIKEWMDQVYPEVKKTFKTPKDSIRKPIIAPTSDLIQAVEKRVAPTPKTIASFICSYIDKDYNLSIEEVEDLIRPPLDKS